MFSYLQLNLQVSLVSYSVLTECIVRGKKANAHKATVSTVTNGLGICKNRLCSSTASLFSLNGKKELLKF
jgi:hypothetical protein